MILRYMGQLWKYPVRIFTPVLASGTNLFLPNLPLAKARSLPFGSSSSHRTCIVRVTLLCGGLSCCIEADFYPVSTQRTVAAGGKSSVLMDVKPWDDEIDTKKLEEAVCNVQIEGLLWEHPNWFLLAMGLRNCTSCLPSWMTLSQ